MASQRMLQKWISKKNLATYIKGELTQVSGTQKQLEEVLGFLLDPGAEMSDSDRLDWLRCIIAGGSTFEDFGRTVLQYDNAVVCGLVWTAEFVAYRCRTCGISPCMSLCSDCFQAGDHTGHDFNMFRSQAGGACDCGDTGVMNPAGFCARHGPEHARRQPSTPPDLLSIADAMMPRLVLRLMRHMRDNCGSELLDGRHHAMKAAEGYIGFLKELSDMGAAMQNIFTKATTNPQVYLELLEGGSGASASSDYIAMSHKNYLEALETIKSPPVPVEFTDIPGLDAKLTHETLLDELIFWLVKFEFPQELVTLLLSFLPDDDYKEAFTKSFIKHYSRVSVMLQKSNSRQRISNRIVHISVQLLSPEALACKMVFHHNLLHIMLTSLKHMMNSVLTDVPESFHQMVDCTKDILKDHCYWPIVSDLINVLSHKPVAHEFMANRKLLHFWFELVACFQGMNVNQRELNRHVEYEPDSYYAAFSAELEVCSSPMWSLLVHCKEPDQKSLTVGVINAVTEELEDWFDAISLRPHSRSMPRSQVSFHLPLHRYLAVFLANAVNRQGMDLHGLLPSNSVLEMLMMHPLQIQVVYHQIFCGMWVRNGLQIRGQAMTYIQCHFCNSMVDADLYLMQVCATALDPDLYIKTILDRFQVVDFLSFALVERLRPVYFDPEHWVPMLEGALSLLALLLSCTAQLGSTDAEVTRMEMVSLLCVADRTHSQLLDLMPERCGVTGQNKAFEGTLKQVSDYKAPQFEAGGTMQQGMYVPKASVWQADYDPLHVMLRAMHRRDAQAAMDRYTESVKQQGLYKGSRPPWPPFRIPAEVSSSYLGIRRLLRCRTLHSVIFTLLYKVLHDSSLSDAVLYYTVYLLELAVTLPHVQAASTTSIPLTGRLDRQLSKWFACDDIFVNAREVIPEILTTQTQVSPEKTSEPAKEPTSLINPRKLFVRPRIFQNALGAAALLSHVALPPDASVTMETDSDTEGDEEADGEGSTFSPSRGPTKQTVPVAVNESIVTLLLKHHSKLTGKSNSYIPPSLRPEVGASTSDDTCPSPGDEQSRVGDGVYFIGKVLDKLCAQSPECDQVMCDTYRSAIPKKDIKTKGKKSNPVTPEERRKRARERQQKLMAEFATQQKAFMANVLGDDNPMETDEEVSAPSAERIMEEPTFDCVICNQTTTSCHERPMCLVTLLLPSSVLGHRRHTAEPLVLPVSGSRGVPTPSNCATEFKQRLQILERDFDETSCMMSFNIGWLGGVLAQTCGHYVHLDCQRSYMDSLKDQVQPILTKTEFWCPLCRQLANTVLPVSPGVGPALSLPPAHSRPHLVERINDTLALRPINAGASQLTDAMHQVMEDIHTTTFPQYKQIFQKQCAESVLLFICSVLRINLELELVRREGSPCRQPASLLVNKRSCLLPLFQVLSLHSKMVTPKSFTDLWARITGLPHKSREISVASFPVPVLLNDPTALLIQLLMSLPAVVEPEVYQCLVRTLYNLVFIQAVTVISCKFTSDERRAWRGQSSQQQTDPDSLERWMGLVILNLSKSSLYQDDSQGHPLMPAICQSVWSPQSVEAAVQEFSLPFLRVAALLHHQLLGVELPASGDMTLEPEVEFRTLADFLQLAPDATGASSAGPGPSQCDVAMATAGPVRSASYLTWYCDHCPTLVEAWCQHYLHYVRKDQLRARMLLMASPTWQLPQLFGLPDQYDKIFQYYRKRPCLSCKGHPADPALCLVCGQLLCFKENCCKRKGVSECVQHSVDCGAGTGLYLIVNSSLVVVVRGPRATVWGSIYLDEHGEEDKDLRRGKPLFLSQERYHLLRQQWITHSFDRVCKRWMMHDNSL